MDYLKTLHYQTCGIVKNKVVQIVENRLSSKPQYCIEQPVNISCQSNDSSYYEPVGNNIHSSNKFHSDSLKSEIYNVELIGLDSIKQIDKTLFIKTKNGSFIEADFVQKGKGFHGSNIFKKNGGSGELFNDFQKIELTGVFERDGKLIGYLKDGRTVVARIKSLDERPTLEIYNRIAEKSIKIRYDN